MGEALLSRLVAEKIYAATEILVSEPRSERQDVLRDRYGVSTTSDNQGVLDSASVLLLAIKPQIFDAVIAPLSRSHTQQLVLSILAGLPLSRLEAAFPNQPIIRAMPNTPATVGAGMTAIAPGSHVKPEHLAIAEQIFAAVGQVQQVPERLIDAVTGVSGSGPGYVALFVEALTDGGVAAGLPRAIAYQLALQTIQGTATLLQTTDLHPAELKDRVTSPGGTTIAGIAALEQAGFRSSVISAVQAAYHRSRELGQS